MATFTKVNPGDPIQAHQLDQIIDALIGTAGAGVALSATALSDAINYALTVQNDEATNSRALNVLKSDGTTLIKADATGVTLGAPLNLPTGSVTSAAIADGTIDTVDLKDASVTSAKIADQSVTNAKLGPDVARASLLTNGGFEIWQRGVGPFTANGAFTADRWMINITTSTASVTRIGSTVGAIGYSARFVYTHVASGYGGLEQKLEDVNQLKGKTLTVAVTIKSSLVGAVVIELHDGVTATQSAANTTTGQERLTVTKTIAAGATTLRLTVYCNQASANATVEINDGMLVVGSVAADYAPLHAADDLARCLRYYEIVGNENPSAMMSGYASGPGQPIYATFPWKVVKAVSPTVTKNGTWIVGNTGQPTLFGAGTTRDVVLSMSSSATGQVTAYCNATGMNLVAEANP